MKVHNSLVLLSSVLLACGTDADLGDSVDRCEDKVLGVGETDLDCGGVCAPCATGRLCDDDGDCLSGACDFGVCRDPSCTDGRDNGAETGVDCGGPCAACDGGAPAIEVAPGVVDFGAVASGESARTITIRNTGELDLVITGFTLSGHPGFAVTFGDTTYPVDAASIAGITLPSPITIAPAGSLEVGVRFSASDHDPAVGALVLRSNDPDAPDTTVSLEANVGGPCLAVQPEAVHFGGTLIAREVVRTVTLRSCGDESLIITSLALAAGGSSEITLAHAHTLPLTIAPNGSATFTVTYEPGDVSPLDGDDMPVLDRASVVVASNTLAAETTIEVDGFGALSVCPTAVIVVEGIEDGAEVAPGTKLKISGTESYAIAGEIAEYRWHASQPAGSVSVFLPSATSATPQLDANLTGRYELELTVVDEFGNESCEPARVTLYVIPTAAIHIELTWQTPDDPDETNEGETAGSDLDLHFLHPLASSTDVDVDGLPDGWFDPFFDCFWNNPKPNWNSLSPTVYDDPVLVRDDTDGGGPEIVEMHAPEAGACYRVGVHYWIDNDFGAALATVRVFVLGNLVLEVESVELVERDLWSVTEVCWPASETPPELIKVCEGTFDTCESAADCDGACGLRIAPGYCSPLLTCPE